jgi:hypothetical protein
VTDSRAEFSTTVEVYPVPVRNGVLNTEEVFSAAAIPYPHEQI